MKRLIYFGAAVCALLFTTLSCTPEEVGSSAPLGSVSLLTATSRTATLAWENGTDAGTFTVSLYRDAACTDEFQSYQVRAAAPFRFTFTYLAPSTTYYAMVSGAAGTLAEPYAIKTKSANAYYERKVLYNNFDALCWGGDYVNSANSVVLTKSPTALTNIESLEEAIEYSKATSKPDEEGAKLMLCPAAVKSLFGLDDWSSSNVYVRPGYIKIGSATSTTEDYIKTPALSTLPENSGAEVSFKAVAISSGKEGEACVVLVRRVDASNKVKEEKSVYCGIEAAWVEKSVSFSRMAADERLVFAVAPGAQVCIDDLLVQATVDMPGDGVYGYVRYTDGEPVEGVAVSDGFSVVATDADGFYMLQPSTDAWYIYISLPSNCKIGVNGVGRPDYYQSYNSEQNRYDFTLEPLEGGAEKKFVLFCLGDPQVRSQETVDRFYYETRKFIRSHAKELVAEGLPCYGITLGDNVSSSNTGDKSEWMDEMRNHMSDSRIGFPMFQVMGNHDHKGGVAVATDARNSTLELAAQRTFENNFGPVNFSFNRGDVHIVGMRDIIYNFEKNGNNSDYASYSRGFTDMQYEWLKQDLALVPEDKMVVLCVHIPLHSCSGMNVNNVFKLLDKFSKAHVMAGHTHDMYNATVSGHPAIEEHTLGATCGCWWRSTLCKDGAPNGYGVFYVDGADFSNWYYQGVNEGLNDKGYQMRLFRGGMVAGGQYEFVTSSYPNSTLLANVFNCDDKWTVKVYSGGQYLGDMVKINYSNGDPYRVDSYDEYVKKHGAPSLNNPTVLKANASNDWFANGYHVGVMKNRNYFNPSYQMYKFEGLTDEQMANVEVVATDRFGNVYRSKEVLQGVVGKDFTYKEIIAPTH